MNRVLTALVIATAALSSATVAAADDAAPDANATVSTISQAAGLGPGDTAPLDFPGVRTIRRGKPIPKNYALHSVHVTATPGSFEAAAIYRAVCPKGSVLTGFAIGKPFANFLITDLAEYDGKHRAVFANTYFRGHKAEDGYHYFACRALRGTAPAPVAGSAPSTATVTSAPALGAGDIAPWDVPGVRAIRRGKPIPKGYTLPGFSVTVHNGDIAVGGWLTAGCPGKTRLRSFAISGDVGFSIPAASPNYVGRRSARVDAYRGRLANADYNGTIYAVCR